MLELRVATSSDWVGVVAGDVIAFLQDHAANERKVSASALELAVQHPLRDALVGPLIAVAREELEHFARVHALLVKRNAHLAPDGAHAYVGALRKTIRKGDIDQYLLDRLLVFGLIEARACERFGLLADGLDDRELRDFYRELFRAEARHHKLYLALADGMFPTEIVRQRLDELLDVERDLVATLTLRPALF